MRLGISLCSAHPGGSGVEATAWVLERARAAASTGLSCLTIGDHHSTGPVPYVQNVPMLGRLLAEWDERPAGCLFLVPAWNPVLMAEQIGTLASIADGPFIVQTGLGGRDQVDAMGLDVPHRGHRLEETIRTVQALLAGEEVGGARIAPTPPREVEWWIGAHAETALDRAARLGTGWYADAGIDAEVARTQMDQYLDACERHGREPGTLAIRKDVFVGDDGAAATTTGDGLIEAGYRGGQPRGAVAYGDVEQVSEQLATFADLGFTDVIIRTMMGIPQPDAVRSIELCGRVAELLAR
ncbi:MAG: LLM class flavin-dependent oxidoreductase [Acidimicrobiales bacterium]|nr:LLM class flavin-dependent oxidoreductase [Acidimicrobiales bacterium]